MSRYSKHDESIIKVINELIKENVNPIGRDISFSNHSYTITSLMIADYYQYSNKPYDMILNGGYKDGRNKIQRS